MDEVRQRQTRRAAEACSVAMCEAVPRNNKVAVNEDLFRIPRSPVYGATRGESRASPRG
jgi:hypothetical protein